MVASITVISYGVLSYSQLFPNLFTRSTTSNSKPLLPHLSHPAKNRTANDFLVDDSSQTNTIPAYANLLRALNQHIITLAVQSPDSTPFPGACPTRWIRWGPDRLLSVPRDDSLEHLYRNLNRDSTRLMGAILTTAPALVVELKSWLSSQVAICQPSFTARRLAPMPPLPQHNIPPGFPLILAPFPNLRAHWIESAEQNPPPPPTESDPPASLTPSSRICFPRARLANSLMISACEPTDELAENAGSYIDWVAQERELQRRAAAAAGKEKTPQKTESPPSMSG
ncbi:hypothetical protein PGTUg99_003539 [Puccinia graminis f. sp. tritici]|uniref:Uncharacterized protein n=1 Tax=Puccinia graminis f. sp. tritici TaxID=56615 RepID=A0A5B0RFK3_PUCGR|nr:hypothetical protein PGTUg99_003539 [Puccinia graminis f. sp. tritici]